MADGPQTFRGDILIEDDHIASISQSVDPAEADCVRDCTGLVAIPGLVNGHTHLSMSLMRNYKDTCANLQDWLSEIFPIEDRMCEEDIYWGSMLALAELIRSGCTSFADMYFKQWMTARACKEAGVRGFISLTLLGVHAIYTCTAGNYRYTRDWAKERGLVVNTHLSETRKEVDDCIREHGMRPAEYLEQLGFFDLPCYVAHGVHLSDTEAVMLAQHNVGLIHNPSSNCKLASGIAPVSRFRKLGLTVGLGTDGASSNNNLSMIKEMRLAAMISTVSTLDVGALPPYEVLKMATIDSARALRADDIIGSLEAGKRADITIINTNTANMTPVNDIFSAIVFSMSENNIDSVYINGRCVLDEGRLTTIDEDLVCREAQRCWNRLRRSE